jgi:hypothetical protein
MRSTRLLLSTFAIIGALAGLGGCTYDYLQRTDRVSYRAGDAVKANLARETTNPSKKSMYETGGLGKNGTVVTVPVPESITA